MAAAIGKYLGFLWTDSQSPAATDWWLQPEGASAHDLVRRLGVSRHPRLRGDVLERESTVGAFVVMKEKLFGMETVCVWESTCLASRQFRAVGLSPVGR